MNRVRRRPPTQTRPARTLRLDGGPRGFGLRVSLRQTLVLAALAVVLFGLAVLALMQGEYRLSPGEVLHTLTGGGPRLARYFVTEVRAPRVLAAILVGAALGLSGAIFQVVSGNPLGSPDIIGFTHGAATGALLQIIVFDAGPGGVALGAVLGGLGTAVVVWGLTRRTGLGGYRVVLIGIGVGSTLSALNSLLVVRASLTQAQTAAAWLVGSLNAMTWAKVALLGIALLILLPALLWLARPLTALMYGDAVAAGIGVPVGRVRVLALFVGVLLVALATATTGPVAFVALAAPHICRTLTRVTGAGLAGAGLTGAVLVLGADLLAQHALPGTLAVGVVTGALGGCYLVYLIAAERRRP
ncbi:FecCD family ABC transporter permease [Rothia kristinae]|uniref:FecCD family ABC transporter permease n=1 Tax=Rothia kristinae TaxID=37923 RepID=UPI0033D6C5F4